MLTLTSISKTYLTPAGPVRVLTDVSLTIDTGEAVAITGPSGSGKSTLLSIIGGLEAPTSGVLTFDGAHPHALGPEGLARFRNAEVGFVFQDHCLLPQCSVLENVLAPTLVGPLRDGVVDRARSLLERVGLGARLGHRPAALSGGEKQRVALARALVNRPRLLLCDEPTGNLDHRSAETVGSLLAELHREHGITLIVVTHSSELARRFPRRCELVDGVLEVRS